MPLDTFPTPLAFANLLLNIAFLGAVVFLLIYVGRKALKWLRK